MKTTLHKDGRTAGEFDIDAGVLEAALTVHTFIKNNEMLALGGLCLAPDQEQADAIRGGGKFAPALMAMLGELHLLKGLIARRNARIAELEKENKLLRAQLELADALRNHKRSKPE